jgi:glycerol kinase
VAWQLGPEAAYCVDGQVYAAGTAIAWLVGWGLLGRAEDLDAVGGSVPDAGGVTVVPALNGLGAPWWRPGARAAVEGIGPGAEPAHLVRATVEGLAAQVAALVRSVAADLGAPLTRLQVDGGLTRSRLLMQTQADLLQMPVEVAESPNATALGVAALARLGGGEGRILADVVRATAPRARFEPAIPAAEAADRLGRFEAAVARLLERDDGSGR